MVESRARAIRSDRATAGRAAIGTLLAVVLWHSTCAFAQASSDAAQEQAVLLAESTKGMVFSVRPSAIRSHPRGIQVQMHGQSDHPRPVDSTDPASPLFQSVESTWIVACHAGTFSIVLDRFLDDGGKLVAVFTESADNQEAPEPGSFAWAVLRRLCHYIAHRMAEPGAGT